MNELKRSTVLLVDDAAAIRAVLRMLLANVRLGEVVGEAENGQQAVELAERLRPDVIILDVHMPVMDGLEALRRINELVPESKVIIYSSYPEAREEALRLGAFRYVEKGEDPDDVTDAVREAILSG